MSYGEIPKIIHYCWFGRKEKPTKVKDCINSWHKYLGDYEFIEWNEDNFDINCNDYVKQAYQEKKYAYVSDYARINALYNLGGIYMDTDVIVYKSFNNLLDNKCILGFEEENFIATSFMACIPKHDLIKEFIDNYNGIYFYNEDQSLNMITNVKRLTQILENRGLIRNNKFQCINDINIYPQEYFSPYDYVNYIRKNTENTYCEHLFLVSWLPWNIKIKKVLKKILIPIIGINNMNKLRKLK
ncbi:glycosyltransferase family 32 protein [Intestinibacter bartlettii]|uniref:glycosyltransferase family 32 protein n=1 Tax=Intestinibacter bartlettii TaxID=261299 RepID=UPI002674B6C3|nr:glycosyltransferase [Intestinibacter bartlettii]